MSGLRIYSGHSLRASSSFTTPTFAFPLQGATLVMSSDRKNRVSREKAPRSPFQHASKFDIEQFPSNFKNDTHRRGAPRPGSLAAAYHTASRQDMPFTA